MSRPRDEEAIFWVAEREDEAMLWVAEFFQRRVGSRVFPEYLSQNTKNFSEVSLSFSVSASASASASVLVK